MENTLTEGSRKFLEALASINWVKQIQVRYFVPSPTGKFDYILTILQSETPAMKASKLL